MVRAGDGDTVRFLDIATAMPKQMTERNPTDNPVQKSSSPSPRANSTPVATQMEAMIIPIVVPVFHVQFIVSVTFLEWVSIFSNFDSVYSSRVRS